MLSDLKLFGLTIFNLLDFASSNILMPLGGLLISIFVGYVVDRKFIRDQMTNHGHITCHILRLTVFSLRYLAPGAIILVFLNSIGLL